MGAKPLCGAIQSKFWGQTQCIFEGPFSEVHFAKALKGGYCSEHLHNAKWNRFFVISGKLKVTVFKEDGNEETQISEGQFTDVPPNLWHQFECQEDCLFIEIYWIDALNSQDIDRRSCGGLDD